MKLNLAKFAVIGACALSITLYSQTASAQTSMTFEAGEPETIGVTATVSNTITADVTAPTFGTIGAIRSASAGDTATLTLSPNGTITPAPGATAKLVSGGGYAAGTVAISGAFLNTPVHVTYSNLVDLTCGACIPSNPALTLVSVADNLTTAGSFDGTTTVVGTGTTDASGVLDFNIGVVIETTEGAEAYEDGAYAGSFDAMIQY